MDKNCYTYIIKLADGRLYIGSRTSSKVENPYEDDYMGSATEFKENPDVLIGAKKVIIKTFETPEEAVAHEIFLHEKNDVAKNEKFVNRARQTSTGFAGAGNGDVIKKWYRENPEKVRKRLEKANKTCKSQAHRDKCRKIRNNYIKNNPETLLK